MDVAAAPLRDGQSVFVGVDGGSSALRAAICDRDGHLLASTSTKGLVPMLRRDGARRLHDLLMTVAEAIPHGAQATGIHLALTGIDLPEDAAGRVAMEVGRAVWPDSRIVVANDGMAAWAGATGCQPGVAVMAGTGCVIVASDHRGEVVRTGGWGPTLGDVGGGWGIGVAALREMLARYDAGIPPSGLDRTLLATLGARSPLEIPSRVTGGRIGRAEVADLARIVTAEASRDPAARQLLDRAARALAVDARRAIDRLTWTAGPITVVPTGNAFHPAYVSAFRRALRRRPGPATDVRPPVLSNVGGAVLLALREHGHATPRAVETLAGYPDLQPGGIR